MQGTSQGDESECGADSVGSPDFYLLVDVDDIQRQMNVLENELHRMKRVEARRKWRYVHKRR